MNIRRFDKWDDMINEYNKGINDTNQEIANLNAQKQATLDEYNANYQNQLNEYSNLMAQQQSNIDTYKQTQENLLEKQKDYNIGLINQNKQEAQEEVNKEKKDAYVDYMKQINQYGGTTEQLASQGLANTGLEGSLKIAMYQTYQNRVSAANTAITKANIQYDNQIQQALNNYDVGMAEVALQTLQQSYALALQGFEYKNTLFNQKTNFGLQVEDNYFNKNNTLLNRIDNYRNAIASVNQYKEKMAEDKRQFNASLAASKKAAELPNYDDTPQKTIQQTQKGAALQNLGATLQNSQSSSGFSNGRKGVSLGTATPDPTIIIRKTNNLPKLSTTTAQNVFNKLLNANLGKRVKISVIDGILRQVDLKDSDRQKIANYFGLTWAE